MLTWATEILTFTKKAIRWREDEALKHPNVQDPWAGIHPPTAPPPVSALSPPGEGWCQSCLRPLTLMATPDVGILTPTLAQRGAVTC